MKDGGGTPESKIIPMELLRRIVILSGKHFWEKITCLHICYNMKHSVDFFLI